MQRPTIRTASRHLRHLRRSRDRGYAIALTALLLIPLLAFVAVAVDLGSWYGTATKIQRASDAAALAGVVYLPNEGQAIAEARRVAEANGFPDNARFDVDVASAGPTKLRVTITDNDAAQFFAPVVTQDDTLDIGRTATAEYIRSVPMGSPRNFLGTGDKQSGVNRENLYVSVSGNCAKREHGDRITPFADANGSSGHSCIPGSPSYVRANPEFNAQGYFYAIEAKADFAQNVTLEIFDAPHCQGAGSPDDSGANTSSARQYDFIVRDSDAVDPAATTILSTQRITPSNCGTMANQWRSFYTFSAPRAGVYYLQVRPVPPTNRSGGSSQEGQNQMGFRLRVGGSYSPCTTDPSAPEYVPGLNCPNIYAVTHLGVYAAFDGTTPSFFLASIGAEHNNRIMEIELFDTAEGAQYIELLDPNGDPATFTWEIGCQDGTYRSENGGACATGEAGPNGGYGPVTANNKYVGGTGTKPWSQLTQDGRYSDRLMRLQVQLPADMGATYGNRTWWRIRYTVGGATGDRTTWTVRIKGDPVRLVPN